MNTEKIASAMMFIDDGIARLSPSMREISVSEAEKIQGDRVDARRTYATDGLMLYSLNSSAKGDGVTNWMGVWIPHKKRKTEVRRDSVLAFLEDNRARMYTKSMIAKALGITRNQSIHAVDMLVSIDKIHGADTMKGPGNGTIFYQFGPDEYKSVGFKSNVIRGAWK